MIMNFVSYNKSPDSWFYGFVADNAETGFTDVFDYDKYGATGVYKTVKVAEKIDGYDTIGSLETYVSDYDNNKTDGYTNFQTISV